MMILSMLACASAYSPIMRTAVKVRRGGLTATQAPFEYKAAALAAAVAPPMLLDTTTNGINTYISTDFETSLTFLVPVIGLATIGSIMLLGGGVLAWAIVGYTLDKISGESQAADVVPYRASVAKVIDERPVM